MPSWPRLVTGLIVAGMDLICICNGRGLSLTAFSLFPYTNNALFGCELGLETKLLTGIDLEERIVTVALRKRAALRSVNLTLCLLLYIINQKRVLI